jgi:hypothetical protein
VQKAIVIIVVIRVFPSAVSVRLDGLEPVCGAAVMQEEQL